MLLQKFVFVKLLSVVFLLVSAQRLEGGSVVRDMLVVLGGHHLICFPLGYSSAIFMLFVLGSSPAVLMCLLVLLLPF